MIRIYLQTKKWRIIYIGCYKDVIKYINVAQILINIFSLKNVMFLCKESVLLEQLNIHLDRQNPRFCFKKFQGLSNLWSGRMRSQSHQMLILYLPGRVFLHSQQWCRQPWAPIVQETRWERRSRGRRQWGREYLAASPSQGTACLRSSEGCTLVSR